MGKKYRTSRATSYFDHKSLFCAIKAERWRVGIDTIIIGEVKRNLIEVRDEDRVRATCIKGSVRRSRQTQKEQNAESPEG